MPPQTIRTFVAIDFPEAAKRQLAGVQQALAAACTGNGLQWTPMPKFHLTLFYLGTTPAPLLAGIEAALALAARECQPFPLVLSGLGAFPRGDRPRVVFIEPSDPTGGLRRLRDTICAALARFDFHPGSAAYRPHITLCKARPRTSPRTLQTLATAVQAERTAAPPSLIIDDLVYMRSVPTRHTPIFIPLQRIPLPDSRRAPAAAAPLFNR